MTYHHLVYVCQHDRLAAVAVAIAAIAVGLALGAIGYVTARAIVRCSSRREQARNSLAAEARRYGCKPRQVKGVRRFM